MRILIAAHGYPPTHVMGGEREAERAAKWLAQHGHQVSVFAVESLSDPNRRIETSEQDGVTVYKAFLDISSEEQKTLENFYRNPWLQEVAEHILAENRFDLTYLISGYLIGKPVIDACHKLDIPVVTLLTELFFLCARLNLIQATGALCTGPDSDEKCMRCLMEDKRRYRLLSQYATLLMDVFWGIARFLPFAKNKTSEVARRRIELREALDSVNCVISRSRFLINKFGEYSFDTKQYRFIRQGLFIPDNLKPSNDRPLSGVLRLGYLGQIKFHKGLDLIIEALVSSKATTNQRVSLDIWGNELEAPDYVQKLKRRAEAHSAIRWNGRYAGDKVWEVLSNIDVLVVPSRHYENSPTVILEAYAMGIPVIATDLGGMAELVEHEKSGLRFRLNDADDLRRQIERLLDEPDLLDRLRAGIPRVKTIDEEMQEIVALYEEVLQSHRGSTSVSP